MTKADIRKLYIAKRWALSAAGYDSLNRALFDQFKSANFSGVKCLHIFLPMADRKEPDTLPMIEWLKHNHPQVTIVYPKCDFSDRSMISYIDNSNLILAKSKHGITESVDGNQVNPAAIDMIILPLLAFDKHGYRVGYGKGFYDRFITQCRKDVQLAGLSFFEPVDKITDLNQYDKKMHLCITPGLIYSF